MQVITDAMSQAIGGQMVAAAEAAAPGSGAAMMAAPGFGDQVRQWSSTDAQVHVLPLRRCDLPALPVGGEVRP